MEEIKEVQKEEEVQIIPRACIHSHKTQEPQKSQKPQISSSIFLFHIFY